MPLPERGQIVPIETKEGGNEELFLVDSLSFKQIWLYLLIFFLSFLIIGFLAIYPTNSRVSYDSETKIDHSKVSKELNIDYSLFSLSPLNKHLLVNACIYLSDNSKDDKEIQLNISKRFVLQKNYEVFHSSTSPYEMQTFVFEKGVSEQLILYNDLVSNFDYMNFHFYSFGNFDKIDKIIINATYMSATAEYFLLFVFIINIIIWIFASISAFQNAFPNIRITMINISIYIFGFLAVVSKLYYIKFMAGSNNSNMNSSFTNSVMTLIFPLTFSIFTSLFRYFLIEQTLIIRSEATFLLKLMSIAATILTCFSECNAVKARENETFLPVFEQNNILKEEQFDFIVQVIYFSMLFIFLITGKSHCKDCFDKRYQFIRILSFMLILFSLANQIFSYLTQYNAKSVIPFSLYITLYYVLSGFSLLVFSMPFMTDYVAVDSHEDVDLIVDALSD